MTKITVHEPSPRGTAVQSVRFTRADLEMVRAAAKRVGLPASEYIRDAAVARARRIFIRTDPVVWNLHSGTVTSQEGTVTENSVDAGRSRLLTAMQIRMELLRDGEGMRDAFQGFKYFSLDGKPGRRLSELRRNP